MTEAMPVSEKSSEPKAGDLSVCVNCGAMLQFNDILVLGRIPEAVLREIPENVRAILVRISDTVKSRGRIR